MTIHTHHQLNPGSSRPWAASTAPTQGRGSKASGRRHRAHRRPLRGPRQRPLRGQPGNSGRVRFRPPEPHAGVSQRQPSPESGQGCGRLSNAAEDIMLETLAYVGGSRWRIETEFETEKGDVGLGRLASPHSHVPAGRSVPAGLAAGLGGGDPPDRGM